MIFNKLWMEKIQINMPEIKTGAGIALLALGGIVTGISLTKVKEKNDIHNEIIAKIRENIDEVDEKTYRKDLTTAYVKKAVDISSGIAAGAALMTAGAALEISSTNSLRSELTTTQLAVNSLLATMGAYRGRVAEVVGEKMENDIYNGRKRHEVEETVVDPETGKKKKVKKEVIEEPEVDTDYNPYRVVIKKGESALWTEDARIENVQAVLRCQVASANNIMMRRAHDPSNKGVGWIWLDELRTLISEKPFGKGTGSGRACGNIVDLQNRLGLPAHDDFVDFGLDDPVNAEFWDSTNMNEKTDRVYINFNCMGNLQPYLSRM